MIAALALAAAITAHAPAQVAVDGRLPVHGQVRTADVRRVVHLQEHGADGWTTLATSLGRRTGRFAFDVSSGHALTTRELRVVAPATARLRAVRTPAFEVRIVLPAPPAQAGERAGGRGSGPLRSLG